MIDSTLAFAAFTLNSCAFVVSIGNRDWGWAAVSAGTLGVLFVALFTKEEPEDDA